jgi:hypothetical protein
LGIFLIHRFFCQPIRNSGVKDIQANWLAAQFLYTNQRVFDMKKQIVIAALISFASAAAFAQASAPTADAASAPTAVKKHKKHHIKKRPATAAGAAAGSPSSAPKP